MRQIIIDIECDEKYCGECEELETPFGYKENSVVQGSCNQVVDWTGMQHCDIFNEELFLEGKKLLRRDKCLLADKDLKREQREEKLMRKIIIDVDCDEKYCGEIEVDEQLIFIDVEKPHCKRTIEWGCSSIICEVYYGDLKLEGTKILRCDKCLLADKDLKREQREEKLKELGYERKSLIELEVLSGDEVIAHLDLDEEKGLKQLEMNWEANKQNINSIRLVIQRFDSENYETVFHNVDNSWGRMVEGLHDLYQIIRFGAEPEYPSGGAEHNKDMTHFHKEEELRNKLIIKFGRFPDCDACYTCQHDSDSLASNPLCEPCLLDDTGYPNFKRKEEVLSWGGIK